MTEPFRFADGDTVADKVARNNPHAVRVLHPSVRYISEFERLNTPEAWAERDAKESRIVAETRQEAQRRLRPLVSDILPEGLE